MSLENRPVTVKSGAELPLPQDQDAADENTDVNGEKCRCSKNSTCEYCCIQEYKKAWRIIRQKPLILSRTDGTICHSKTVDEQEELADYSDDTEYDVDVHSKEKPRIKRNNTYAQSDENQDGTRDTEFQSQNKLKVNWDTDFKYSEVQNCVDSDSEETRDAYEFEQSGEIYRGSTLNRDPHCSPEAASETGPCDTDLGSHRLLDATHVIDQMDSDTNTSSSEKNKGAESCCNLERSNESCDIKSNSDTDSFQNRSSSRTQTGEVFTGSVGESCKRTRRNSKRKRDTEDSCPICSLTIRSCELKSHFDKEVENLSKIHKNSRKIDEGSGINTTFVQVKSNRENRLAAKIAKYSNKTVNHVTCPVCCLRLEGSEEENNEHVLNCSQDSDIDVLEREDSFEEYEFGNETRVRAISLVPGGYRALHGHSSRSRTDEDNDEDLNVDVDDTLKYGKPQELDVIHNLTDAVEAKQLEELRKAVIDPSAEPNVLETRKWTNSTETEKLEVGFSEKSVTEEDNKSEHLMDKTESTSQDTIVSALKEKIKNLEDQSKNMKCLICLEPYTKPVVSTSCWHVYCEECWLMTMGVKKLCPQCNIIVFPSDLRRIYL